MNENKNRKIYIDALKGWLMVLVIWSHTKAYIDPVGYILTAGYMGGFFFLTGYVSKWNRKFVPFIKNKAKRLLIPFFLYGIGLISFYILNELKKGNLTIESIKLCLLGFLYNTYKIRKSGNSILLVCDNNTFWFITTMLIACVMTYVFYFNFKNKIVKSFFVCIGFIGIVVFDYILNDYFLPWGLDTAFVGAVIIIIGTQFQNVENGIFWNKMLNDRIVKIGFISFLITIYCFLIDINPGINMAVKEFGNHGMLSIVIFIMISVISALLWIELFKKISHHYPNNNIERCLAYIGKNSITFMAIQIFLIRRINAITKYFTNNMFITGFIATVGTLLIGIFLCQILDLLRKNHPVFDYL